MYHVRHLTHDGEPSFEKAATSSELWDQGSGI